MTLAVTAAGDWPAGDPHEPIHDALAVARAARVGIVATREAALRNSVVNRARDIVCGTLAILPLTRTRDGEDIGPGWLERPDPFHSRGWFVSWVTDDLFFRGVAYARVTVRDGDDRVQALEWMPWAQVVPHDDDEGVTWYRSGRWPAPVGRVGPLDPIDVLRRDLVVFESPLVGVLNGGDEVLSTAARLNGAADRFAGVETPAGWLKQNGGEAIGRDDALALIRDFSLARQVHTVAFLNEVTDYHESSMDPSRLQLVEGRAYQDAAVARVCNMPNFVVGVGVPNDSMTYKTALTARLDLIDFGLGPFLGCWEQTLSAVVPRTQDVVFDVSGFLRSATLTATAGAEQAATVAERT